MGDSENNDELLLPDGCRVEVRVRKNGRKDKIIIEKATAEGLPPGWTKEIKVTKTGRKVRRDPYYIDPVSGYIFRSMKDAVRYVETGKLGRLAYKRKDDGNQDEDDLEDDKDNSATSAKKQKLEAAGTETDITGQSSKLIEVVKNEDALDIVSEGERVSLAECTSNQGEAGTDLTGSNLSEAKDSDKMDERKYSDENMPSTPVVEVLPHGQSSDGGEMTDETKKANVGKSRSRKKKVLDLPRRASKRLAGLALDPTPELKARSRARRAAAKQPDEVEASAVEGFCSGSQFHPASQQQNQLEAKPETNCAFETSKSTGNSSESSEGKHPDGELNVPSGEIEMGYKSHQNQGFTVDLPLKNLDKIETDFDADRKPGLSINLPLGDLLSDPCIAFAIKTLTEETFETSNDKEKLLESNSSKYGKQRENESMQKQENLTTQEQQAANVVSKPKPDEKLENPIDFPFADIWRDPCIEFAIKTLTGTIPVGNDLDVQDYFQQQLNSPQTQPSNNFCQTEFLCQQYDSLEKPISREQAQTGNLSIQNPGGTGFRQQGGKRCNECH